MREILFRGQTRRYGEKVNMAGEPVPSNWVYGGIYPNNKGGYFAVIYQQKPETHKYPVYADTIGQYTGLTDKNDKKIFEGDILNCCLGESYIIGVVKYDQRIASFFVDHNNGKTSLFVDFFLANQNNEKVCFEVVGNIHDNPELLADL